MKRSIFLFTNWAMLYFCFLTQAYCATTFKLAVEPAQNTEKYVAAKTFKAYIEAKSQGRFKIQFVTINEPEKYILSQVQKKLIDLCIVNVSSMVHYAPKLGVLNLPYVLKKFETVQKATQGEGAQLLNTYAKEQGFEILTWIYSDYCNVSNAKHPIITMNNIKNLKIRSAQNPITLINYTMFGATPVPLPINKTLKALEQKRIDGMCNGYLQFKELNLPVNQQKFITETHFSYILQPLLMSGKTFSKMNAADKKLFQDGANYAQKTSYIYQQINKDKVKAELQKLGFKINTLKDEAEWEKLSTDLVWPEFADFLGGKPTVNKFLKILGLPIIN